MSGKRLLIALKRTILICASLHLILLGLLAAWRHQYELINLFGIIDLKLIWPSLGLGLSNLLLGTLLGASIYLAMLFWPGEF